MELQEMLREQIAWMMALKWISTPPLRVLNPLTCKRMLVRARVTELSVI